MAFGLFQAGSAWAQQPHAMGMDFQTPGSTLMERMYLFHNTFLLPVITGVTVLVFALILWCIIRFNAKRNPVPSRTSHNTLIEVIWTVLPVLLLVYIAIPSFKLLYEYHSVPPADLTVKATGYSWYWNYSFPDQGELAFDSRLLEDKDRTDPVNQPRLLAVDNELVVPVNKVVRLQITADPQGVIHAFGVPSLGVKADAIPGRLNEAWFKAERPGIYYGQCYELCGANHAFMPIAIRVVEDADFQNWLNTAKQKFAESNGPLQTASVNR